MATGTRGSNENKSTIWKRRGRDEGQFINKCPSHFMGTHQSRSCNTKRGRAISYAHLHSVGDCVISKEEENACRGSSVTASHPLTVDNNPSCDSRKEFSSECPSRIYCKSATNTTSDSSVVLCFYNDRRRAWTRNDISARTAGEDLTRKKTSEQCRIQEPKVYSIEELAERRRGKDIICRSGRNENYGNLGVKECTVENIYSRWPPFFSRSFDREQLPESCDDELQSSDDKSCGVSNANGVFSEKDRLFQRYEGEREGENELSFPSNSNPNSDCVTECEIPLLTNHPVLPLGEVCNRRDNWNIIGEKRESTYSGHIRGSLSIPAKRGFLLGLLTFFGYRRIDSRLKLKSEKAGLRQSPRDYSIDQEHATALISDTDTFIPHETTGGKETLKLIEEELTHGQNQDNVNEYTLNLKTSDRESVGLNNRCCTDLIDLDKSENVNQSIARSRKVDKTEGKSLQVSTSVKTTENIRKEVKEEEEKKEKEEGGNDEERDNTTLLSSDHFSTDFHKDSLISSTIEENVKRLTNDFVYTKQSNTASNKNPNHDDIIFAITNSSIDYSCDDVTSPPPGPPNKTPPKFVSAPSPALNIHTAVPTTIGEKSDFGASVTGSLATTMRSTKLSKIGQLTTRGASTPATGDRTAISGIDRMSDSGSGHRNDDFPAILARNAQRAWTTDGSSNNLISTGGRGGDAGDRNSNIDIGVCVGGAIGKSDAAIDSLREGEEEAVSRQRDKTQTYIMENTEKEKERERTEKREGERAIEEGQEGESCSNKPSSSLEPEVVVVALVVEEEEKEKEEEEKEEGKIIGPKLRDEALVRNARPEEAISVVVAAERSISVRADDGLDGEGKNDERLNDRLLRCEESCENKNSSMKICHHIENKYSGLTKGHYPRKRLEAGSLSGSQEGKRTSFECGSSSVNFTPEFENSVTGNPIAFSSFGKNSGAVIEYYDCHHHVGEIDPGNEEGKFHGLHRLKGNEKHGSKIGVGQEFLQDNFELETNSKEISKEEICKDRSEKFSRSDYPQGYSISPIRLSGVVDRNQHQKLERQEAERQDTKSHDGRLQSQNPSDGQIHCLEMKEVGRRASRLVYANQSTIDSDSIDPLSPCLPNSPLNPVSQYHHLQEHQSPIILGINPVDIRNKRLSHQYLNCAITGQTYPDFLPQEQQNPSTTSPKDMIFTATTMKETSFTTKPDQNGLSNEHAFIPVSAEKRASQEGNIISLGSSKPGFGSVNGGLDNYKLQHLPPASSSAGVHHYYNNKSIFSPVGVNNSNGISCTWVPEQQAQRRSDDGGEGYKFYPHQRNPIHNMTVGTGTPCGASQQSQNSLESTVFCQSDYCGGGSSSGGGGGGICNDNNCSVRTFTAYGPNQESRSHSAVPFHLLQQRLQPHHHHHPGNPFPPANFSAEELQRLLQCHHQQQQISSDPRQQLLLSSLTPRGSCQPPLQHPRSLLGDGPHHHHHHNHQHNSYNQSSNHEQQNQFDDCDGDSLIQNIVCFKHNIRFSPVSLLWTFLSFLVAGSCLFSFLTPYWIVHPDHAHSFGLFNLCVADPRYTIARSICVNYGAQRFITRTKHAQNGTVEELGVIFEGSGAADIRKIPSGAWQTACLLFGAGCCVQILGAVLSAVVLALSDPWHRKIALANGYLQTVGVLLLIFGLLIYPAGFSSPFFSYYCDSTRPFYTGHCSLGWSYVTAIMTSALSIFCPVMSNFSEAQQASSRKSESLTSRGPDV